LVGIRCSPNPLARSPKLVWPMTEQDALDILTLTSFIGNSKEQANSRIGRADGRGFGETNRSCQPIAVSQQAGAPSPDNDGRVPGESGLDHGLTAHIQFFWLQCELLPSDEF
jgi:hypothetical protein